MSLWGLPLPLKLFHPSLVSGLKCKVQHAGVRKNQKHATRRQDCLQGLSTSLTG